MSSERAKAYAQAGVNIEAGNALVSRIKDLVQSTQTRGVISDIGGFGGLFRPDLTGMAEPVLVASTDGVGTKLKLAFACNKHDTVGIDLVAMSVNDILVQGATPLFFLDYFATGKLDVDTAQTVVGGVAEGCRRAAVPFWAAKLPKCLICTVPANTIWRAFAWALWTTPGLSTAPASRWATRLWA